jgi:hypothetical protein
MTSSARRSPSSKVSPAALRSQSKLNPLSGSTALPRSRTDGSHLRAVSDDLSAIDVLIIRHGQLECGPGTRPIVPRCMTALPQNLTEILESLLPQGC